MAARTIPVSALWTVHPPPGLTPVRGLEHRFQEGTVRRLELIANERGQIAVTRMRQEMLSEHQFGTGKLPQSIGFNVQSSRTGVSVKITAGNFRHLRYITKLGGGDFRGGPYPIFPRSKEFLRFFWRGPGRPNRWVRLEKVMHPGFHRDIMYDVAVQEGKIFRRQAMNAVSTALAELTNK